MMSALGQSLGHTTGMPRGNDFHSSSDSFLDQVQSLSDVFNEHCFTNTEIALPLLSSMLGMIGKAKEAESIQLQDINKIALEAFKKVIQQATLESEVRRDDGASLEAVFAQAIHCGLIPQDKSFGLFKSLESARSIVSCKRLCDLALGDLRATLDFTRQ